MKRLSLLVFPTCAGGHAVGAASAATACGTILTIGRAEWIVVREWARALVATKINRTSTEELRFSKSSTLQTSDAAGMPTGELILCFFICQLPRVEFAEEGRSLEPRATNIVSKGDHGIKLILSNIGLHTGRDARGELV
jgi:hypothetical protein